MNNSGINPVEFKVLVKVDEVEEKTAGGIILTPSVKDQDRLAQTKATLIAVGGNAFGDWEGTVPSPGDRIMINKYQGYPCKGKDDQDYRLCNDKDVIAVIDQ